MALRKKKSKRKPAVCFAPGGEPHSNCQNKPFSDDANFPSPAQRNIWIGYRNDMNRSYNGCMTFGHVLAQAESKVMVSENSTQTELCERFPGTTISGSRDNNDDIFQQLQQGKRALREATCANVACETRPEPELLQMEWIPVKSSATNAEVFLIGYVFQLQGCEMIAICLYYYHGMYRFQRTDGSVSPDMFLRLRNFRNFKSKSRTKTSSKESTGLRRSARLNQSGAFDEDHPNGSGSDDEDLEDSSVSEDEDHEFPSNGSPPTTPRATDDLFAQSSPSTSTGKPAHVETDEGTEEAVTAQTTVSALSTEGEYDKIFYYICRKYGARAFGMPNINIEVQNMEQAVRNNNRLSLYRSFAKVNTALVKAGVGPGFLDEDYEEIMSSAVAELDMNPRIIEGVMFMESMGEAVVADQREHLGTAYANLRAYMVAYTGHAGN